MTLKNKLLFLGLLFISLNLNADPKTNTPHSDFELESIAVEGSSRITTSQVASKFELYQGKPFTRDGADKIKTALLGMGLFEKVTLFLKKGTNKKKRRLVIRLKDDKSVITDWGIGAHFGVTLTDTHAKVFDLDGQPLNFRLNLVARNAFRAQHRLGLGFEINSLGQISKINSAFGLPKYRESSIQFDTGFSLKRNSSNYLDIYGFGAEAYAIWSLHLGNSFIFRYGVAGLANREPNFSVPSFPETVVGPYLELESRTSLLSFINESGHRISLRVIPSVGKLEHTYLRSTVSQKFQALSSLSIDYSLSGFLAGNLGYGTRTSLKFGFPFGTKSIAYSSNNEIFLQGRYGRDWQRKNILSGYDVSLGIRVYSSALIGELAFKFVQIETEAISDFFENTL